ncbi:MAG: ABC transporter substrate-binding protein [Chloroflexi bacterium]|nr:ABC transporter substrate-binding protein [Chloroflexota bacterium]
MSVSSGALPGWDPQKTRSAATSRIFNVSGCKLAKWDERPSADPGATNFIPDAATEWAFESPTKLVFHLRRGVKLPNGREVTSEDYKWNHDRMVAVKSVRLAFFIAIDTVETPDPYTIIYNLKESDADFMENLTGQNNVVLFKEYLDPTPDGWGKTTGIQNAVGCGPFKGKEAVEASHTLMERNDAYTIEPGFPLIDQIRYVHSTDPSVTLALYLTGQLDWRGIDFSDVETVKSRVPQGTIVEQAPISTIPIRMDLHRPPLNDVRVRRALNLALDRQSWIDSQYSGKGQAFVEIPPIFSEWSVPIEKLPTDLQQWYKYDPARARQLLKDAGYGSGVTIPYLSNAQSDSTRRQGELLQAMWSDIGVTLDLKLIEYAAYLASPIPSGGIKAVGLGRPDVRTYYWELLSDKSKFVGDDKAYLPADDPKGRELAALVEKARLTPDKGQRLALVRDIQTQVADGMWVMHAPSGNSFTAVQPWVKDFSVRIGWNDGWFTYLWLDK